MTDRGLRIVLFLGALASGLALDLATKRYADAHFQEGVSVFPGLFDLVFTVNRGGAFGIFQGRHVLFLLVSVGMLAFVAWAVARDRSLGLRLVVALGLLAAGIAGNLHDRLSIGGVRDFLDVYIGFAPARGWLEAAFGTCHWPTFNVADSFIVVCGIGAALSWRGDKTPPA